MASQQSVPRMRPKGRNSGVPPRTHDYNEPSTRARQLRGSRAPGSWAETEIKHQVNREHVKITCWDMISDFPGFFCDLFSRPISLTYSVTYFVTYYLAGLTYFPDLFSDLFLDLFLDLFQNLPTVCPDLFPDLFQNY